MSKRAFEGSSEDATQVPLPSLLSTSEQLTLQVMSIMKDAYKTSPRGFWGLRRSADLLAPRGFLIRDSDSYKQYREGFGFPVVKVRITGKFNKPITIPLGETKVVIVGTEKFNSTLTLCEGVEEVFFLSGSAFDQSITLPPGLRKIVFAIGGLGCCPCWPLQSPYRLQCSAQVESNIVWYLLQQASQLAGKKGWRRPPLEGVSTSHFSSLLSSEFWSLIGRGEPSTILLLL